MLNGKHLGFRSVGFRKFGTSDDFRSFIAKYIGNVVRKFRKSWLDVHGEVFGRNMFRCR